MALINPILDVPIHHKGERRVLESKLSLGIKSFSEPRHRDAVYADKRSCAYVLAARNWPQILTRPCGFGKGTLLFTLDELFQQGVEPYGGNDSSFKGLPLEQLWQHDGSYLVLHLD